MSELRLAFRRLLKRPASTFASVATLACAIGAAAVTWSALSAVLINPLPVHDPASLYAVATEYPGRRAALVSTGSLYPRLKQIRESGVFSQTVAHWSPLPLLVDIGQMPTQASVGFVTHDFFDVLGVQPSLGRDLIVSDDSRSAQPAALLTHRFWRRSFNGDPSVIGRTLSVSGKPAVIVGVLPRAFRGMTLTENPNLYLAFHTLAAVGGPDTNFFAEPTHSSSPTSGVGIIGRISNGSSAIEAAGRLAALDQAPQSPRQPRTLLIPVNAAAVPAAVRPSMERFSTLLAATVLLLLLIGCTTVGMLLLIRTESRRDEFAMCMALGASRGRLARGIAFEGALLGVAGSLVAVPLALWLFSVINVFRLPGNISIELLELRLDLRTMGACIVAASVAVLVIAAIAGALGFRSHVADALRARSGTASVRRQIMRAALGATQVAVALTLVGGAGLLARSLVSALSLNPGLDMSRVVTSSISLQQHGYTPQRGAEFFSTLHSRLSASPAVEAVAMSLWESGMGTGGKILVDGQPRQFPSMVSYVRVARHFFPTMGIRLVEGRNFGVDDRGTSPPVAIVSESFARLLAEGRRPLGLRIGGTSAAATPVEIIGVASDVITNVNVLEPLVLYLPADQGFPALAADVAVRSKGAPASAKAQIAALVRELDPQLTSVTVRTLEERIAEQMAPQRLGMTVLGALGAIAILLTLLGTYVLADSMASTRMKEMGIRAALGATRRQLGSMVLSDTVRLVGVGVLAGLALSWMGTSTIRSFLFRVEPFGPATLATVAALILLLAVLVSLRAALRVARVDLAQVLRND